MITCLLLLCNKMMSSMMIIIVGISSVVRISSATVSMPLQSCESKSTGDFDTDCDADLYVPSLPLCGKGQRLNNECVTSSQVSEACVSCEPGFFQRYNNHCGTCHQCSVCGAQQRRVQPCNAEQDTVCEDLDPSDVTSPENDIPSSSTDTDSPKTAAPSTLTTTDGTASGTTPGRTSTFKPTTAAPEDPPIMTTGEDVNKVDTSAQDGTCKAVIPLAVCVVLLFFGLVVVVIFCFHYRSKAKANLRRNPIGNADVDIEGKAYRYMDFIPLEENRGGRPSSPPRTRERLDRGPGEEHPRQPPTPDEPLYATVNKNGNPSKAVAADHERPTSSSGRFPKSAVCKTIGKVLKDRRKGARKKETEPGSVVEKDHLLSPERVAHDNVECGGSKRLQPMHGTVPIPSVLPTASPSLSPPSTPPPPVLERLSSPPPSSPPSSSSTSPPPLPSPLSPPSSSPPPSSPPPLPSPSSPPSSPPSSSSPPPSSPPPLPSPSSSPSTSPPQSSPPLSPPSSSTSLPPLPSPSSPSSSPSSSTPPTDGIPGKENGVGEGDGEEDDGDAATNEGHDTKAHSPGENTSCTSPSVGTKVTKDLVRGAEGGASSLPPVSRGVKSKLKKNLPEPGDVVGEKNEEELKNQSIDPDEVVSERFLDGLTDVISLVSLERIGRNFGLQQVVIDNLKDSLAHTSPKNIGFQILRAVLKRQGHKLTFRCLLTAIRDCGDKNAADTLIAEFRIDLNLR